MSILSEATLLTPRNRSKLGEPAWDVALLFPAQGNWTEEDYWALNQNTNWLIELSEGILEVLPMPTPFHQRIVQFLFRALEAFVLAAGNGEVFFAPLPVWLWEGKLREPDIVFVLPGRISDSHRPAQGVDLVMEVVSEGEKNRARDLDIKRREFARAGIPEYWIVDPETATIHVLRLDGDEYQMHGEFALGSTATSVLLPGFALDVTVVFAAG
jgi:Uma2 family endonuclease